MRGGRYMLVHSTKNTGPEASLILRKTNDLAQPQGPLFSRKFRNSYIFKGIQKSRSSPALSHAEGKAPGTLAGGGYEGVREAENLAGPR